MKNAGFTIIELLIVIAMLGICAAIAIPCIERQHKEAQEFAADGTVVVHYKP